jgi:hypothetical protein
MFPIVALGNMSRNTLKRKSKKHHEDFFRNVMRTLQEHKNPKELKPLRNLLLTCTE